MIEKTTSHAQLVLEGTDLPLVFTWQGEVKGEEFVEVTQSLLDFTRQHQVKNWLLNLEAMEDLSSADQHYLATHWLTQFLGLSLQKIALLPSRFTNNQMAVEYLIKTAQQSVCLEIQFFSDTQSALAWLYETEASEDDSLFGYQAIA